MKLQHDPNTASYAYISSERNSDGDHVWATEWYPTEAQARQEAIRLTEPAPTTGELKHERAHFTGTESMKIKTNELTDAALDFAVCVARAQGEVNPSWFLGDDYALKYSSEWAQGGPIIEHALIAVGESDHEPEPNLWKAEIFDDKYSLAIGPTPLIAAMRCFVASSIGDEVEIPDELTRR